MLFSDVKALLRSRHGNAAVDTCLADIDNIFLTSLESVQPMMSSDRRCFELYGYDILLVTILKPWLIEVLRLCTGMFRECLAPHAIGYIQYPVYIRY